MNIFKRVCFVAFLMLISVSAFSGELFVKGGVVKGQPGKTGTIDIYMNTTDEKIEVVQFDLTVPEGVSVVVDEDELPVYTPYRNLLGDVDMGYDEDSRTYTFLAQTKSKKYVTGTDGLLISINVEYSSDFAGGNGKLSEILLSGKDDDYTEDAEFTFEVGAPSVAISLANDWNTYCSEKALDFTDVEVEVFVVSEVTPTSVKLSAVKQIPAEVGFLIKGSGSISVPIIESADAVTSKLVGVIEGTKLDAGNYVLSGEEFVPCSAAGILPANKAYLPAEEIPAAGAKAFTFDFGESTGINEVKNAQADGAIYSISGVRVAEPQKGVYIMNGRKVIVK